MYITLECSGCGASSQVSYFKLYELWQKGYETLSDVNKASAKAVTEILCHCGCRDRYDAPMTDWVFQTIFNEFIKEHNAI